MRNEGAATAKKSDHDVVEGGGRCLQITEQQQHVFCCNFSPLQNKIDITDLYLLFRIVSDIIHIYPLLNSNGIINIL